MVWVITVGIVLFIILILLLLHLKIRIQYCYQKNNHQVTLHIYFIKIRLIHRTIKINEYTLDEAELMELLRDFSQEDKNVTWKERLKKVTNQLREFRRIFIFMIKSISIHELKWITHFGTGDASSTGTLAGGVWAIKGTIIGLLFEQTEMKIQPKISVIPHFQQKGLYSEVDCIVTIRLGKAIRTAMQLMRNFKMTEEAYS